jgi:hypothetical protein
MIKHVSSWSQSIAGFTALFVGIGGIAPVVRAAPNPDLVAQVRRDLCRQVFRDRAEGLVVYQEPNPFSSAIGSLVPNQQVELVPDFVNIIGPDGANWLQITAPVSGYIANGFPGGPSNLVYCSFSTPEVSVSPTPVYPYPALDSSLCRRVTAKEGLAIRQSPDLAASRVGGVGTNESVQLENFTTYQSADGRVWVPITYPVPGFVSSGFATGGSNLTSCSG